MYSNYPFVLEWTDLAEELRAKKVDRYIEYLWHEGEPMVREKFSSLEKALEDWKLQDEIDYLIALRFPVYF